MYTLIIPHILKTNSEGYEFLAGMMTNILGNVDEDKRLLSDFSQCAEIDGNLSAVIGSVLDKVSSSFHRILVSPPRNNSVKKILARNHFLRFWNVETNIADKENYVEYNRFKNDISANEFKKYIQEGLINKQRFPQHTDLAGEKIVESIFEIYANAIMHGKTEYVHSCGEYMTDRHVLEMTIVDCGQTIPGNVKEFFDKTNQKGIGDCDAIDWAFVSGNTTKLQTGGLGLAIIKEFIGLNEGSIQVVSGRGFIEYRGTSVERYLLSSPFPGTVVNMKFNFDDNKKYYMKSENRPIDKNDLL